MIAIECKNVHVLPLNVNMQNLPMSKNCLSNRG